MPRYHASTLGPLFREKRNEKDLTQLALASLIGAKQSQISSFESGDSAALSGAKVAKAATLLEVDPARLEAARRDGGSLTYCAGYDCPTQDPHVWNGCVIFKPLFLATAHPRCRFCGERLRHECSCGAAVDTGLNCSECGRPYIAHRSFEEIQVHKSKALDWVQKRRDFNVTIMMFTGVDPAHGAISLPSSSS